MPTSDGPGERDALDQRLAVAIDGLRAAWSRHRIGLIVVLVGSDPTADDPGSDAGPGNDVVGRGPAADLGELIRVAVRPGDAVARIGPGRFAVLCERLDGIDDAVVIAWRVEQALARVLHPTDAGPAGAESGDGSSTGGSSAEVLSAEGPPDEVSILITLAGPDDGDAAHLLAEAERLNVAPGSPSPDRWVAFDESLRARARLRVNLEADLRATSGGADLYLEYQPEREPRSGRLSSVEALVRWDRDGVEVRPDDFIPLAEETGLIVPIGAWVLDEACAQLARWRETGAALDVSMAVNVSPRQLLRPEFVDVVAGAIDRHGLGPGDLVLEITENVLLVDVEAAVRRIEQLRSLGVRIAIDDFGTGHASLTYLHRLPIDAVKLDRSFVAGLGTDDRLTAIVTAIVALIHAIGVDAIAEGVGDAEQCRLLGDLGCTLVQGSFVGPPVPPDELVAQLP